MYKYDVSVTVVSYNSEATIIETLESIKNQIFKDIELIVSDDGSVDNTIGLAKEWLSENSHRFVNAQLLTVEKNTGVTANCNRARNAAQGKWVKGIAADDILLPTCISDYMSFVNLNPEIKWASSYVRIYNETFEESNCVKRQVADRKFFSLDAEGQLQRIVHWNKIYAASLFVNHDFLDSMGGYDESYPFEDYVFNLNALERGEKCYFLDKETSCYRIHQSIFNAKDRLFNYNFLLQSRRFHEERCFKYLTKRQIKGQHIIWRIQDYMESHNLNKKKPFISLCYNAIFKLISGIYA